MGIPQFFRHICERYPCVTEKLKDYQIPEFDNLYLDMNGIIHACSHPNDTDITFRISEETIFNNISRYLELLFRMIQPQKLFFIAIDGVAPCAKISQQRSRRFRAAKDAEIQELKAKAKGVHLPKEKRFDSNCITPGTLFMAKLDEQLKYFMTHKLSSDKLWQKCEIIFSGSEVPGEGEHKIMDYIRYMKAQPDYDINTKHCLYGLDSDLIMLGLCTHEIHFTLLREEVTFGKKHVKTCLTPEETKFCLFHVSLLREYIDYEFSSLKKKLPFPYDLVKIIDDWVLMGFLMGNDFIPHLANLHIFHGALSVLCQVYMDVLPTLDGYINETGTLRLDRFERFMERLSRFDLLQFSEYHADMKYLESKMGRPFMESKKLNNAKSEIDEALSPKRMQQDKEFDALLRSAMELTLDDEEGDDESDPETHTMEFVQKKRDYYMNKLNYENIDRDFLRSQAEGYVRAIQWNLHYYYNGCCSWSWYYPHHYAPYISDIKDFKDLKLEFDMGEPLLPFEQLLAALPASSKDLLPPAFQPLITNEESPIYNYYPQDFKTDLNGKRQEWEAVVLIPFIDGKTLLNAMSLHYSKLTPEEQARNKHGPMCLFTYTEENLGVYKAPEYFPDIISHAKVQLINREDIIVPGEKLVSGLCPGVRLDVYYPGFPTFQHVNHTVSLEKSEVRVFQTSTLRKSMIFHITPPSEIDLSIASQLLGKTVFVNWPHLREAFVVAISEGQRKLSYVTRKTGGERIDIYKQIKEDEWNSLRKRITETYKTLLGIELGETEFMVYVRLLIGKKHVFGAQGKLHIEKQWAETPIACAYQIVVQNIESYSNNNTPLFKSIDDVFLPGTVCFMLGHPYYGATGKVSKSGVCKKSGRVKVSLITVREPSFDAIRQRQADFQTQFMSGKIAGQRLGISTLLLSRVTGSMFVKLSTPKGEDSAAEQTCNIGLNLKFTKRNAEVRDYIKKTEDGYWHYSPKTIELIRNYMLKWPTLFERLAQNPTAGIFLEEDIFTPRSKELTETLAWLKENLQGVETRTCGTETIESSLTQRLEKEVDAYLKLSSSAGKVVEMQVQSYLLYVPGLHLRNFPPDPKTQTILFDRVCCTKDNFTVPIGYKGTVIGIQKMETVMDTMYEVLFDKTFVGGMSINGSSEYRAYRLSGLDFINISYGERVGHHKGSNVDVDGETWNSGHEAQMRANASAFASYRTENHLPANTLMSPRPRIVQRSDGNNQQDPNRYKYNPQNVHRESYKPTRTTQQNVQLPQNVQKKPSSEPTSEFQAIWNELHKKQEPSKVPHQGPKVKHVNKGFPESSPQDPSAFLKAVLKIPDGNAQQPAQQSVQPGASKVSKRSNNVQKENKVLDTPPLVQQMFDRARQNEIVKDDKKPICYCTQLLNYFQLSGRGLPRYSYFANVETNMVQAHVLLPDKRVFIGEPCVNQDQAAASAAKKVYTELKLASILPNMKVHLPPQHWYPNPQNSNWSQNIRPPGGGYYAPDAKALNLFPNWVQRAHGSQQHTSNQIDHYNRFHFRAKPPQKEPKDSTAFVPLQAQKKSRNVTTKQTKENVSKENTSQSAKDNPMPATQPKKQSETSAKVKTDTATVEKQNPSQSASNQIKTTVAATLKKPKKSRVAAKFGLQTDENNCSKNSIQRNESSDKIN